VIKPNEVKKKRWKNKVEQIPFDKAGRVID
jgi:hypothetical protein